MANKYEGTIKDLKSTFFDIFYEHTEEMTKMIEMLADDRADDVVQCESAIFQRIILLYKAASNVKILMDNVKSLNAIKGVGSVQVVSEGSKALVGEVVNASIREMGNSSAVVKQQKVPNTVQTPAVQAPVPVSPPMNAVSTMPSSVPIQPPVVIPFSSPVNAGSTMETSVPVQPTVAQEPIPFSVPPVVAMPDNTPTLNVAAELTTTDDNKTVAQTLMEKAAGSVPELKNDIPEVRKENDKRGFRLIKTGDSKVKAILITDKQYEKLSASRATQFTLLDFGATTATPANPKAKIEDLMKKASALYKEGKVSEAQALFTEISALNKQAQSDGKPNVLIKKAA